MPLNPNVKICTHIKVTGHPCGSPALRDQRFCYFHQRVIRGVRTPPKSRIHPIALLESAEAIQVALMETINAIVRNQIDLPRANLILRALNIAVRNSHRVRFDRCESEMVRAIPDYQPAEASETAFEVEALAPSPHAAQAQSMHKKDPQTNHPKADRNQSPEAAAVPVPRKPPARVTSVAAAQAQAVNARPLRE